jgi:hypothetical protein
MIATARAAASLAAMLYVLAILSLAGTPGQTLAPAARTGNVIAAGEAMLGVAASLARVDLAGEVTRALGQLRPAPSSLLRR